MKKRLTALFIMVISLFLLVGCSGSDNSGSGNSETGKNEQQSDEAAGGEKTVSYDVMDFVTGEGIKFELTYDSGVFKTEDEFFEDAEKVTNLTESGCANFYHTENGASFSITILTGVYSALEYYEDDQESYADADYKEVIFSDLTTKMVGDTEVSMYTQKLVWDDGDELTYMIGLVAFEDGILYIESYGDEEDLQIAQDSLDKLLVKAVLNGKEPGVLENVYTLCDYTTGTPLYTVRFNPKVFRIDENCDPFSGEMVLKYVDTSLAYSEMIIHVNEYASGEACFNSERYYSYGINYYIGDDGNFLETGGYIGEATVYIGLGLAPDSVSGYVFFAEMPDGNVITGNIPGSYVGDSLDIMSAFLTIEPVE